MSPQVFSLLLPETILSITAVVVIVAGAFWPSKSFWTFVSAAGLIAAGVALLNGRSGIDSTGEALLSGPIVVDTLSGLMRALAIAAGVGFTFMFGRRAQRGDGGELHGMILFTVVGVMLASSAANLVLLFLALELISIPTYVLLFLGRAGRGSAEASAKYFLLSILSSALFMLGASLLYGVAGSMDFAKVSAAMSSMVAADPLPRMLLLAFLLTFAGLCFKIAAVPFHFYAPDVYAAATNANAGLLAVAPKVAGIVAMVRLLGLVTPVWSSFGWQVALILAVLTMTVGNTCALWQTNVRRLLAYSSIAHAGYMLIGIAVAMAHPEIEGLFNGTTAALLYAFMYCFASIGAFAVLSAMSEESQEATELSSLSGIYRRYPLLTGALAVCMFSLAGLPPLPGFWGKFGLLGGAVEVARQETAFGGWFVFLAIVGAVNAAIGAAYYLRVVATTFFGEPADEFHPDSTGSAGWVAVVCGLVVVILGCMPGYFIDRFGRVEAAIEAVEAADETVVQAPVPTLNERS